MPYNLRDGSKLALPKTKSSRFGSKLALPKTKSSRFGIN